jgi:hypothetical protein
VDSEKTSQSSSQTPESQKNRRLLGILFFVALVAAGYHLNRHFNSGIESWSEEQNREVQEAILQEEALAAMGTKQQNKKKAVKKEPDIVVKNPITTMNQDYSAKIVEVDVEGTIDLRVLSGELARLELKVGREHPLTFSNEEIVFSSGAKYWIDRVTLTHVFQPAQKLDHLDVVKSKARVGSLDSLRRGVRFVADAEIKTRFEDGKIIGEVVVWRGVDKKSADSILEYQEQTNPQILQRYSFIATEVGKETKAAKPTDEEPVSSSKSPK